MTSLTMYGHSESKTITALCESSADQHWPTGTTQGPASVLVDLDDPGENSAVKLRARITHGERQSVSEADASVVAGMPQSLAESDVKASGARSLAEVSVEVAAGTDTPSILPIPDAFWKERPSWQRLSCGHAVSDASVAFISITPLTAAFKRIPMQTVSASFSVLCLGVIALRVLSWKSCYLSIISDTGNYASLAVGSGTATVLGCCELHVQCGSWQQVY